MSRFLDKFQQIFEYILALAFIVSSLDLIGEDPLTNQGFMSLIFGGQIALYVYMAWFFFMGVALIYAKRKKKKRLHKNVLMAMYLTTIYTSVLSTVVFGFAWTQIIDDVIIGGLAAWFWIRWKFKTEYYSPRQFRKVIEELRQDSPPS